ncbi:MAG: hypothetical protein ACKOI2_03690, partial [Actinomycetota bacterium]
VTTPGGNSMSQFNTDDQWRSFQTFVAAYLVGMLHPRDVFTISRRNSVAPPLVELRCDPTGALRFSIGDHAWSDADGASIEIRREDANQVAAQVVDLLRGLDGVKDPADLRVSGSGPASSVAVLAKGGFLSGGQPDQVHPARKAAQAARMAAAIDVEGDPIEAAARDVGDRAYATIKNGTIAAQAAAGELARLRSWVDPFSPTPQTGYLVGMPPEGTDA